MILLLARYEVDCTAGTCSSAEKELFLRKVSADQLHLLDPSEFDRGAPLAIGDMVQITGLQSAKGQQLNGQRGEVVTIESQRLGVCCKSQTMNVCPLQDC